MDPNEIINEAITVIADLEVELRKEDRAALFTAFLDAANRVKDDGLRMIQHGARPSEILTEVPLATVGLLYLAIARLLSDTIYATPGVPPLEVAREVNKYMESLCTTTEN